MLHQVGVLFDLYYDARKHKSKTLFQVMQDACGSPVSNTKQISHVLGRFGTPPPRYFYIQLFRRST